MSGVLRAGASRLKLFGLIRFRPFDETVADGRAKERLRRVALSAATAAMSKVLGLLATLISLPLALSYLGAERFGIWSTLSAIVIVLQFADLGIGNGLINAVSEAQGKGERGTVRRYLSSGLFTLSIVSALVLLALPLLVTQLPLAEFFKLQDPLAKAEISASVAATIACIALGVPLGLVQRAQIGLQLGFVASLWQCLSNVLSVMAIWLATSLQLGLPWLVLALLGAPLLTAIFNAAVFFAGEAQDLRPSLKFVEWTAAQRLLKTGGEFLILQIAVSVVFFSDSIMIASVLGPARVADYAVPERLFAIVTVLLSTAFSPLWPAYRDAIARNEPAWVIATLRRSLTTAVGVSLCAAVFLFVAGPWLIRHWVGAQFKVDMSLLLVFGIWKVLESIGIALSMFLNGAGVIRLQIATSSAMLVAVVLFKPWLIGKFGIVGAPMATALIYFFLTLLPIAIVIRKLLREFRRRASATVSAMNGRAGDGPVA